jgi:5-methylcytosine-specific restriction endonuclease McrA
MLLRLPGWLSPNSPEVKRCGKCLGRYLARRAFHKDRKHPSGYVRCCKDCVAARSAKRYADNGDTIRAGCRARAAKNKAQLSERRKVKRAANRTEHNAKQRAYARANPDKSHAYTKKWREKNAERVNATKRAWDKANPASRKLCLARYRARLKAIRLHPITKSDLESRISVFGDACAYCGGEWSHLDHVKPIAKGGPHCLANLRPACAPCNRRKHSKSPKEWFAILKRGEHK